MAEEPRKYVCILNVMRAHMRGESVPLECYRKSPCGCSCCHALETLKRKEAERAEKERGRARRLAGREAL